MLFKNERKQIVEYGQKLVEHDLTKGTGGNLSIFFPDDQMMMISPSGIPYFELKPTDIVIMDLDGKIIEGDKEPSSEEMMHRLIYQNREDIKALIHTHSTYATSLSLLRKPLPPAHYMIALAGKDVRCAEYATYGTKELAENALKSIENRKAVLLANHGLLAGASDLANAFNVAEEIEFVAEVYWRAKSIDDPVILSEAEMELMQKKFSTYGQVKKK
ncbi:MAG: L-fuculose-phosphate aldolase [Bacillota bacterium]